MPMVMNVHPVNSFDFRTGTNKTILFYVAEQGKDRYAMALIICRMLIEICFWKVFLLHLTLQNVIELLIYSYNLRF